jgi:hypothetical protein
MVREAVARTAPVTRATSSRCTVTGDSLAVGVGSALRFCSTFATKGLSSEAIAQRTPSAAGGYVVISAGANDPENQKLESNLETIRARAGAARTVWIAPRHRRAAQVVERVARRHGDAVVSARAVPTFDGVHPSDYPTLGRMVRARLGI